MFRIFIAKFIKALDYLDELSRMIQSESEWIKRSREAGFVSYTITQLESLFSDIDLSCSLAQSRRLVASLREGVARRKLIDSLDELQRRVRDDLETRIFYCVKPDKLHLFIRDELTTELEIKKPSQAFGETILQRFPEIGDDVEEAIKCYICERFPACVFHLMRAVEVCIPRLAQLVELEDRAPSWGAVLKKVEKIALYKEYKDVPDTIKPHVHFFRDVLPTMQAMQRSWRNKISHFEGHIVPVTTKFDGDVTTEILNASKSFLLRMAKEMP